MPISPKQFRDMQAVRDRIDKAFETAAKERPKRQGWIGDEPAFVVFEREELLKAVNHERAKLDKPDLDLRDIRRVEQWAVGHIDYRLKLVLYCAELVFDTTRGP